MPTIRTLLKTSVSALLFSVALALPVSAASKAIDRAGFSIIATGLEQCLKSEDPTADRADMEKLFLSLA